MSANDIQIGGSHYQRDYQHWDFVCDTNMPYLIGCATKYVSRWRDKNGIEDLRKSIHYLEKATERDVYLHNYDPAYCVKFNRSIAIAEATVVELICQGLYHAAITLIKEMISDELASPGANYIDPDKNYTRG